MFNKSVVTEFPNGSGTFILSQDILDTFNADYKRENEVKVKDAVAYELELKVSV